MIDQTNPAGRLYKILSSVKGKPDNLQIRAVWSQVFGCEVNDDAEITRRVIEVYNLYCEVEKLIKMVPNINHKLYLNSFQNIEKALFPLTLNGKWSSNKPALNDSIITRLQFCANELSEHYSEETIENEELENIINIVNELFDLVKTSSLTVPIRLFLLEELEKIRSSIAMYQIKGAKGVKEALQATLGAVLANNEELSKQSASNFEVISRLGDLIDKIDSFTSRALKLKKIISKPIRAALEFITNPDKENENPDTE